MLGVAGRSLADAPGPRWGDVSVLADGSAGVVTAIDDW